MSEIDTDIEITEAVEAVADEAPAPSPEGEPVDYVPFEATVTEERPAAPQDLAGDLERLHDVPVELAVEIGRTRMTIGETLALGPGSIITLNRLAGEPVDLLVNLADARYAKVSAALVLNPKDHSAVAAGGHGAAVPPEGYGAMTQEAIVRAIVTDELTGKPAEELEDAKKRDKVREHILERIHKETDVHADDILFPDLTVQ